ncbi:hypothetical protein EYV94_13775 [Puteibacter caeruleilacunae]|nr:hypothetical protein EYV94_13775 [Puteibacter caeruleilacunae]
MKQERLKRFIKKMYRMQNAIQAKEANDRYFRYTTKEKKLRWMENIIDLSLQKFYSMRMV